MATTQSELYKACVKASQERARKLDEVKKLAFEACEERYSKEIIKNFEKQDYAEIIFVYANQIITMQYLMEWLKENGFAVAREDHFSKPGNSYSHIRLSLQEGIQEQKSKLYQECVQAYQNYREQKFVKECAFEAFDKHYTEEIIKDFGDKSYSDVVFYHNHKYTCGDTRYTMTHFIEWAQAKGFKVELRVFPSNTTVRLML